MPLQPFEDCEARARGQKVHTEGGVAAGQEKPGDLVAQRSKDLRPDFGRTVRKCSLFEHCLLNFLLHVDKYNLVCTPLSPKTKQI